MENYNKSKEISRQIIDVIKGNSTKLDELEFWITNNKYSSDLVDKLTDKNKLEHILEEYNSTDTRKNSMLRLEKSISRSRKIVVIKCILSIAAATIFISMLVYNISKKYTETIVSEKEIILAISEPTLILSSGEQVDLTKLTTIDDEVITISKNGSSEIIYNNKTETILETAKFNTLIIPEMCNYTVILSDGTKVILNAKSRLSYPSRFSADSREVLLEGEGYFEVSNNKSPFIVKSQGVEITVYGTKFNINSYKINSVKTILFEGIIGVHSSLKSADNKEHIMTPNQILKVDPESGEVAISNLDASKYKSWVSGHFYSNGETLEELILSISKWYNKEFVFLNEEIKNIPLVGVFKNSLSLDEILETIENVLKIKFIKNERGYMIN